MFIDIFPSENRAVFETMWKKYGTPGEATDDNIIRHVRITCRINTATDTLRICNTYCLPPTAKNGCTNATQYYVLRTTHVLFSPTVFFHLEARSRFSVCQKLLFRLQPLALGVLQCIVICVMVSSQTLFQRNKSDEHLMLWGQIHCPSESCDGLSCVAGRGREEPSLLTRLTKNNIQPSLCFNIAVRFHCCPHRQEVHKRLQVILSKYFRVIGNHPRRTPTPHLHESLHIQPITVFIHRLSDKFFRSSPLTP